ncbi:MAG: ParB/RepB/Spo0J family partition protein [Bacteroidales bacterium]|nr:ParB/RepB/Spo0J family partition protein [Bacteroidales bacterium]
MTKKPALGRGLGSLMGDLEAGPKRHRSEIPEASVVAGIAEISIAEIDPNPENPRKDFSDEDINELAESIKNMDIIQPITVRKHQGRYQIISGERRFRASKIAGKKTIPAYIRVATDIQTLEMAVTENIQRENLNPIEIALTYEALREAQNLTQEQLSNRLGKSRAAIANHLRLLKLPAEIQMALKNEEIHIGHAKPLITLESDEERIKVLHQILKDELSVRQVEELCKKTDASEKSTKLNKTTISDKLVQIHDDLSQKLETQVRYKISKTGKGQITIEFNSEEDFHRIISMLK